MTHREQWEEKSFQVFTDEDGVLRSGYYPTGEGLVNGNVQVDRVWGNIPMQPDDDRSDMSIEIGGGYGDIGWDSTYVYISDTLRTADYNVTLNNLDYKVPADSHTIATTGYSNFPGYIENYAGDNDPELEVKVPKIIRLTRNQAQNALEAANLDWSNDYFNPSINGIVSTGTTVRFYVDNTYSLKAGDEIWPDNTEYDYGDNQLTITAVNEDPAWIEVVVAEAPDPALDTEASGTVWPGDNVYNIVLQASEAEGAIIDEGDLVTLVMLGD